MHSPPEAACWVWLQVWRSDPQEELSSKEMGALEMLGNVTGRVDLPWKIGSQCGKGFSWLRVDMDGLTLPQFSRL